MNQPGMVRLLSAKYRFDYALTGAASTRDTALLITSLERFFSTVGDSLSEPLRAMNLEVRLDRKGGNNYQGGKIRYNPGGLTEWTVTHELAHALDAAHGWQLSQQMRRYTGSGFTFRALHYARPSWKLFWYRVGSPPPPCGVDKNFNSLEGFAETVTAYIFPDEARRRAEARGYAYERWGYTRFHDTPRGQFFERLATADKEITLS